MPEARRYREPTRKEPFVYVSLEFRAGKETPWPLPKKTARKWMREIMLNYRSLKQPICLVSNSRNPKRLKKKLFWLAMRIKP